MNLRKIFKLSKHFVNSLENKLWQFF